MIVGEDRDICGAMIRISDFYKSRERGLGVKPGCDIRCGCLKDCLGCSAENELFGGRKRHREPFRKESRWKMRVAWKLVVVVGRERDPF